MKSYLFVDGSNLYASQFSLFGSSKFLDFSKFISEIGKKLKVSFDYIYFYASYSPRPKRLTKYAKNYLKNEAFFYKSVQQTKKVVFFKGYRSLTSGKEKEVDVKLTADLVRFGFENRYRRVYLLTGDADFLQALFAIGDLKKEINLICVEDKIMYKGAFYFSTSVIDFVPNKLSITVHPRQKIKIIKIQKSRVVKKIPQMHASEVG